MEILTAVVCDSYYGILVGFINKQPLIYMGKRRWKKCRDVQRTTLLDMPVIIAYKNSYICQVKDPSERHYKLLKRWVLSTM